MTTERAAEPQRAGTSDRRAVALPDGWRLDWVAETGSTNADLVAAAHQGAAHGEVLVTDLQHTGRGRLGRVWTAPSRSALLVSVLLRVPEIPLSLRGWSGAVAGLAIASALDAFLDQPAELKWPNDVMVAGDKIAGILVEMAGDALVIGVGVNVTTPPEQLPRPDATTVAQHAADQVPDRSQLLESYIGHLQQRVERWRGAAGDMDRCGLRAEYVRRCCTVSSQVRVDLPDGTAVTGRAVDVDEHGALVVDDGSGLRHFPAGDVHHVRPTTR